MTTGARCHTRRGVHPSTRDPWSKLGARGVLRGPVAWAAWLTGSAGAGAAAVYLGSGLGTDSLLVLGLMALLVEGALVSDLLVRGPLVRVLAALPVPAAAVRRALRGTVLVLAAGCALGLLGALSALAVLGRPALSPILYWVLPTAIAAPVYAAASCRLLRSVASPDAEDGLAGKLGGGLLPADTTPLVYGAAVTFGCAGSWLVLLHLALRLAHETGSFTFFVATAGAGAAAALVALAWLDRRGPVRLRDAAPRLAYLDRQGLVLASLHQPASPRLVQRAGRPAPSSVVAVQMLRRAPLLPAALGLLALLCVARAQDSVVGACAAGAALGLLLDAPASWRRDRLLTPHLAGVLGWPASSVTAGLLRPALLLQLAAAVALALAVGLASWRPDRALLVGAVALVSAVAAGRVRGASREGGWTRFRGAAIGGLVLLGALGP